MLGETSKILGDAVAAGVMLVTKSPDARKTMTMPEAQSIGHPIIRMLARRVPAWVKPYLPKSRMSPEDAADIEEMLATLAKWSLRLVTIAVTDFMENKEQAQAKRQQERATQNTSPQQAAQQAHMAAMEAAQERRADEARQREMAVTQAAPSTNGHNPAFDVLNSVDIGFTEG